MNLRNIIILGVLQLSVIGYSGYEAYKTYENSNSMLNAKREPIDRKKFLSENLGLSMKELDLVLDHPVKFRIPKYNINNFTENFQDTLSISAYDIIKDPEIGEGLFWKELDFLGFRIREYIIESQLRNYDYALSPKFWESSTADDWSNIPSPIKSIATINMIRYWNNVFNEKKIYDEEWLLTIGLKESIFYPEAINKDDLGLWQHSKYARDKIARKLRKKLPDKELFNPYISSMYAVRWMNELYYENNFNLEKTIMAYNVGSSNTDSDRAKNYLNDVKKKYADYFINQESPTWSLVYAIANSINK